MKDFKVLLVEDEKQMSMFIQMELTHEGYEVDAAYEGREAGIIHVQSEEGKGTKVTVTLNLDN